MIQKINQLVEQVVQAFQGWDNLEGIVRIPYHGGGLPGSPLFCLKLDVLLTALAPGQSDRHDLFPTAEFFETSPVRQKDRFFLQGIPVHIEYKLISDLQFLVDRSTMTPFQLPHETTFGLFRLFHGIPLVSKTGWIQGIKARIEQMPSPFWTFHRTNLVSRLEHCLSDMAAAVFNRDSLFFQTSQARFLETACETLFTINHQFLCPPEEVKFQLDGLEILPAGFTGYLDTLLREDILLDRERRLQLARRLAENILALG